MFQNLPDSVHQSEPGRGRHVLPLLLRPRSSILLPPATPRGQLRGALCHARAGGPAHGSHHDDAVPPGGSGRQPLPRHPPATPLPRIHGPQEYPVLHCRAVDRPLVPADPGHVLLGGRRLQNVSLSVSYITKF